MDKFMFFLLVLAWPAVVYSSIVLVVRICERSKFSEEQLQTYQALGVNIKFNFGRWFLTLFISSAYLITYYFG